MPIVHVYMWKGQPDETVKEIMAEITDVFVCKGIPAEAVRVIIHETSKTHWGIAGKPASEIREK
ncbi:MAG: tautomerase family protein [Candidatus Hodarchaeota archaeon]